jgi:hypothetical protein
VTITLPSQQQRIDDSDKDDTPGMCLAVVAVAAMSVVGGERNGNGELQIKRGT